MNNLLAQSSPELLGAIISSPDEVKQETVTIPESPKVENTIIDIPDIISAFDLAQIKAPENRYLVKPFLPISGTALIAGQPDTGKSQFARQLAIQITQGHDSFLGFDLNAHHNRAIYVATEDDAINIQYLMAQQHLGLDCEPNANLTFYIANGAQAKTVIAKLETLLKTSPADLIVIDGFGDIFDGSDMNSNSQMRAAVNQFDSLAKKYAVTILFVHHINKVAYDKKPNQQSVQGGSGLVQKVRLAWQLSSREDSTKELVVTKGNYCPPEYKNKPITLSFDPKTFIFSRIAGDHHPAQLTLFKEPKLTRNEGLFIKGIPEIKKKLENCQGISYSELVDIIHSLTDIPESSIKKNLSSYIYKQYIKQDLATKLYHWNEPVSHSEIIDQEESTEVIEPGNDLLAPMI